MKLGKIERIDVREIWKKEEDFNIWIVNDGLKLLMEELGIEDFEVYQREMRAGDFFADIVVKIFSVEEEKISVIESQLTRTDHDHLGKLLTYSAVLDADYVVWISPEIREEHRKALEWLNDLVESSDKNTRFFLIRLELWKINDSPPAPKFSIVVAPNDWAKEMKKSLKPNTITSEKGKRAYKFLTGFYEFASSKISNLKLPSVSTPYFYEIRLGTSKASIRIGVNISSRYVRIGIVFLKDLFDKFKMLEEELKKIFTGEELKIESPKSYKKYAFVDVFKRDVNFYNETDWKSIYEWLYESYMKFKTFFEKHRNFILS